MRLKTRFICLLVLFISNNVLAQKISKKCGFQQVLKSLEFDTTYLIEQNRIKNNYAKFKQKKSDTVITIPVVVHVIYKNQTENISEAQIYSQIEALNQDMRKLNADTSIVKSYFSKADIKIEFCLTKTNPTGTYTSGITRTYTTLDNVGVSNQYFKIKPSWGKDDYLNIWVCDFGNNIAGQGFPPGSPSDRDGVVIDYTNFGTIGTAASPYDLGRTVTHEIGHWLNLLHIWGANDVNPNCNSDDGITDTPEQSVIYTQCQSTGNSCLSEDMTTNYLGYVFDRCMANFTLGQKTRMRNALLTSRSALVNSTKGCNALSINESSIYSNCKVFPNPNKGSFSVTGEFIKNNMDLELVLFDFLGKKIPISVDINPSSIFIKVINHRPGIHFLKITNMDKQIVKKVILNN